jgi:mannosyltransferase OCH1-like enzyme
MDLTFEEFDQVLLDQKGRIIHQVWFGTIPNKKEARKTYKSLKKYRDSWVIKNPTWYRVEWSKKQSLTLVKTHYPEYLDMYNHYKFEIQRCDAVRYFMLHRYGGLYADMDYTCCRPFDEALAEYSGDFYLVQSPNGASGEANVFSNSLMYSKPGHVFWRKLFPVLAEEQNAYCLLSKHVIVMFTTGPSILSRVFNQFKIRHTLAYLPWEKFHPHGVKTELKTLDVDPSIFAIHLGKGSWEGGDSKFFLFLLREKWFVVFILLVLLVPFVLALVGRFKKS